MTQLPFMQAVLFPVDLRYGWNLRNPYHQQLLQRANNLYKPFTTTIDSRNHPWRKISKDDSETLHAQQLELPMLQFLAQHCIHLAKHQQKVIIEGPARSTIWSDTPLGRLRDHSNFKLFTTDMCRFSDKPDGTRHLRKTRLLSNIDLKAIQQQCTCREGHTQLNGLDETIYRQRSTHTNMYSHQFCRKLCCDITSQLQEYQSCCVPSGKATDAPRHSTLSTTVYPTETVDDDALPQTLPPVSPSTE